MIVNTCKHLSYFTNVHMRDGLPSVPSFSTSLCWFHELETSSSVSDLDVNINARSVNQEDQFRKVISSGLDVFLRQRICNALTHH